MPTRLLGPDFQINIDNGAGNGILGTQFPASVITLADGRYAVTYQSPFQGASSDQEGVAAIFNVDGSTSIGYDDVTNQPNNQDFPAAAPLPDGGLGVIFTNDNHADGSADADPTNVTYVRVAPNGSRGTPLAIGDFNGGFGHDQLFGDGIATLSTGRQVVAFERFFASNQSDVFLNVVSADGLSTQFTASSPLAVANTIADENSAVVAAAGNKALVVYMSTTGTTEASINVVGRLFDGTTNALGAEFTIADHAGALSAPKIAALDDHRYVVVYVEGNLDIFGRIVDTSNGSISPEFQIDQFGPGVADNAEASVAATPDGGFIVAWGLYTGTDWDVYARRYNRDAVALTSPFIVNRLTNGDQQSPAISVSGNTAFIAWADGASRPGDTSPPGVRGQMLLLTAPPDDFNEDGASDMLWRNDSGALALWSISRAGNISGSGFLTSAGTPVMPDPGWSIAAVSDFTGDGRADLLWRNTSGQTVLWTMNGAAIADSGFLTSGGTPVNPDPSWSVAGAGDFTGDGMSDLLWRNAGGSLALWTMNGSAIAGSGFVTSGGIAVNPDASWSVAGIGDFNGDGKSDILWRNSSGELVVWSMNGSTVSGSGDVSAGGASPRPAANWSVAGIGDFDGDGRSDVLWRDSSSGALVEWLMNGAAIVGSGSVSSGGVAVAPDASWHIVEIGDFNGDARTDILWRNDGGQLAEWWLQGTSIIASVTPSSGGTSVSPDVTWHTQAKPADFA